MCLTLFTLANFLKALVTKLLSTTFYRTAHFKKVKEALDKVGGGSWEGCTSGSEAGAGRRAWHPCTRLRRSIATRQPGFKAHTPGLHARPPSIVRKPGVLPDYAVTAAPQTAPAAPRAAAPRRRCRRGLARSCPCPVLLRALLHGRAPAARDGGPHREGRGDGLRRGGLEEGRAGEELFARRRLNGG